MTESRIYSSSFIFSVAESEFISSFFYFFFFFCYYYFCLRATTVACGVAGDRRTKKNDALMSLLKIEWALPPGLLLLLRRCTINSLVPMLLELSPFRMESHAHRNQRTLPLPVHKTTISIYTSTFKSHFDCVNCKMRWHSYCHSTENYKKHRCHANPRSMTDFLPINCSKITRAPLFDILFCSFGIP